ncbi:MAG: sugar ABC transporter ATP-binding protein [Hespellia sp.]|nr:sugar ABC transporter ATP-binding protein [Hespellia sp.]
MSDYIVNMQGIEKSFGSNQVLHGVDFLLKQGSIHALLGENGTGKTTLMNILTGILSKDGGNITVDDKENNCIAFIHQELTLVNDLNVYENLFLGCELKKQGHLDKRSMYEKATEILMKMEIELDPNTKVEDINASYKQVVEIARALMKNAKVIIMDEPTSSLTNVEIDHVFTLMRGLKKQGVSFVFISHKLNEVLEICDEYTVMRDGCVVATGEVDQTVTEASLAKHMVGKDLSYDDLYIEREIGPDIMRVENLEREREFEDINFHIGSGEIVGFTGLLGDGRSEIFNTVYGCNKDYKGKIFIGGKECIMHSTGKAQKQKISYLPRNRKENGIIKDLSVGSNMSISILERFKSLLFVDKKKEKTFVDEYVGKLNIKVADTKDLITSLSGGNQQKAILAKAISSNPKLVILDNPTQGVDIGAKLEIYEIIMKLAQQGVSFVVLSSEAQEILMLCDRLYVLFHGKVKKELTRKEANEENIMILATGGNLKEA